MYMSLESSLHELGGHSEVALIHDQDIPMHLWDEAARTTIYFQKRILHSALGFKTREEIFIGKKLEVSHLKIFGCPVFVHIPKEKITNLDSSKRKEYLLDIVRYPRISESIYHITII